MPADSYYEDVNHRLASEESCLDDRESTEEEVNQAIEQEQIIEASRSVRAGTDMLFSALRKAGAL